MKTLKLFNSVLAGPEGQTTMSELGLVIEPSAAHAKEKILDFYTREKLNGNDLNKTFHKSWKKIKESSRFELLVEQIMHYLSTYGSNFQSEVYIPNEVLEIPEVKLKYVVIRGLSKEELIEKSLNMLRSGIALKEETINDLIEVLVDTCDYTFTGKEGIRNKEAIIKIAESYGVYPDNPEEFLRYIVYRSTDQTLLIKSPALIAQIKESSFNPTMAFKSFGLERLAEIFNRFKPIFLAYKDRAGKTVNKISKLSKKYHRPMPENPLNKVTSEYLTSKEMHWLENATPFALFKALAAINHRLQEPSAYVYRIRNGKSWLKDGEKSYEEELLRHNHGVIVEYLIDRYNLEGKKIFLPENITYALPTSEKMFVGNIPTGTKFLGNKLAVGIYWENDWGARDLDLSGINIGGKVGWNSSFKQGNGSLMFSGDITNAPTGAVEYMYANRGLSVPTIVMNNVFSGSDTAGYKVIAGLGDNIDRDYMMNPNNLIAEAKTECVEKQMVLGIFIPTQEGQSFVLLNFGAGQSGVSRYGSSEGHIRALFEQWRNPLSFDWLVETLGAELVDTAEEADYDFSIGSLEKDSFTKIFEKKDLTVTAE